MEFVRLRSFPSRLYAEMVMKALEKEGIPSVIKGEDVGIMLGSYSTTSPAEVSLWVPDDKLEYCRKVAEGMLDSI